VAKSRSQEQGKDKDFHPEKKKNMTIITERHLTTRNEKIGKSLPSPHIRKGICIEKNMNLSIIGIH